MPDSWRISALADRHRALGSQLEDWNGMGTAWTYASALAEHHAAIRSRAGLMDVSGLKKVHYVGPHAEPLLQEALTRDVRRLYPGRCVYSTMLSEAGKFIDDCIVYRTGPTAWLVVHGAGAGHEVLTRSASGRSVAVLFDDDLHDLSLQGPLAVEFLARHVPGIRALRYFHHISTQLFERPVMISRTGYTGERGYEIFCKAEDAPLIWDTILTDGADLGIVPCAFTALDWLRVESYLLFYPYDNSQMYPFEDDPPGDTLWELGLDFTVTPGKTGFRGAEEHRRLQGRERFKIFGVLIDGSVAATEGDTLWTDGRRVGVITCAMYSALSGRSMALARVDVPQAVHGTPLQVRGSLTAAAIAHELPFDDPQKSKRTATD
ncbi:MAG TPA: aminomethyltransferase family protein [Solirubrobacteraceae bacterium]|nr:aminomethyltransferase family protein [Solirubrobacteraceae bacterium]